MSTTLITRAIAWPRRYKVVVTVFAVIVSAFCGYRWLMTPTINPNPTMRVVMRGRFPFDKGWELRIARSFHTQNSLCKRTARVFFFIPQAEVSREKSLPFIVPTRLDGSRYEVEYYEDYFLPGFCDWTPGFASYYILQREEILNGAALLGFPHRLNKMNFSCFMWTVPVRTPNKIESRLVCSEGLDQKNSSFDPSSPYGEVNFTWTE